MKNSFGEKLKYPIRAISLKEGTDNFLSRLGKIASPPKKIYVRGALPKKESIAVAVVGARKCSDYGKEAAYSIAKDLASSGIIVVSGMAVGIDSFAHKGAIDAGGKTIAVLGTGIDEESLYPKENIRLARKIAEYGGAVISEFLPGTPGFKQNFPKRNRIIVGLSQAVLVVEARLKSGSLITAKIAKDENKKVFAIPGSIYWQNSKGTNLLIRNGAKLIRSARDILSDLGLENVAKKKENKNSPLGENSLADKVLSLLKENSQMEFDQIIKKMGLPPNKISPILSLLEAEGEIKSLGRKFQAIN